MAYAILDIVDGNSTNTTSSNSPAQRPKSVSALGRVRTALRALVEIYQISSGGLKKRKTESSSACALEKCWQNGDESLTAPETSTPRFWIFGPDSCP